MSGSDEVFDPWAFDTGLIDDIDFAVESARFGYNANIGNGEALVLTLAGKATDHETGELVNEELEQFYSCGKGWETYDEGKRARREDGRPKSFNNRSAIVSLIEAAVDAGAKKVLAERGGPLVATIWEGLVFHMKQKETDYGGDIGKKSRLLPVALVTDSAATTTANTTTSSAKTQVKAAEGGNTNAALLAKLRNLAASAATHDEFIDKAFSVDGVSGNEEMESLVVREDGIFAEARA